MTVYVDVLVVINLVLNYLLLSATTYFTHQPTSRLRLLGASALSGVLSVFILVPGLNSLWLKVALCLATVVLGLPFAGWRGLLKNTLYFLAVNFLFAGLMVGLEMAFSPGKLAYINGVLYFDLPITVLVALAGIAYLLVECVSFLLGRFQNRKVRVRVQKGTASAQGTGFVDTGNSLQEPFRMVPVVLADRASVEDLLTPEQRRYLQHPREESPAGLLLIPYHTVSGGGLLPIFYPDSLQIFEGDQCVKQTDRVAVGIVGHAIGQEGCSFLLSPQIVAP